ncbi:MAG: hypothetical protein ACXVB5_22765, partial [Isosphaeraceae bacterium]
PTPSCQARERSSTATRRIQLVMTRKPSTEAHLLAQPAATVRAEVSVPRRNPSPILTSRQFL